MKGSRLLRIKIRKRQIYKTQKEAQHHETIAKNKIGIDLFLFFDAE